MMPIGDRAILEILLRQMKRAGINHIVLTVGHLSGLMQAFFRMAPSWDLILPTLSKQAARHSGPLALVPNLDKTFMVSTAMCSPC
jgi:NDP-sugar pyrophosphorylase family protein